LVALFIEFVAITTVLRTVLVIDISLLHGGEYFHSLEGRVTGLIVDVIVLVIVTFAMLAICLQLVRRADMKGKAFFGIFIISMVLVMPMGGALSMIVADGFKNSPWHMLAFFLAGTAAYFLAAVILLSTEGGVEDGDEEDGE
jgi:hypothetical protein